MSRPSPSRSARIAYAIGAVAFGVKDNGFSFFLLLYYNQVLRLPEEWVGAGMMVALLIDAVSDPIVGNASDHLHSRWGRRHPFMYGAALPVAVSYWALWSPPAGLAPEALLAWFVSLSILVRLCLTFYEIPSASLAAELTDHYDERTTILGWRFFFGWWGGLTMAVLAYAVFLQPDAAHPVGVLNPEGYRSYGLAASLIMLAAIVISAVGTHPYIPHLRRPPERRHHGVRGAARELWETLTNRSFLMLFCAGIFSAMAAGLTSALAIYFNTYYWGLSSDQISLIVLSSFVSAALAVAGAPALSRRLGKKSAAMSVSLAAILLGPAPVLLRLLGWFPANGTPALLPTLVAANAVTITLVIMSGILVSSMVADVVEDSEVRTGRRSEGVFFAANAFVQKAVSGIGVFGSTLMLNAIGFPRGAAPGDVPAAVLERMAVAYGPTIIVLYLIALAFLGAYRIDRARHEENLATLASRRAR